MRATRTFVLILLLLPLPAVLLLRRLLVAADSVNQLTGKC